MNVREILNENKTECLKKTYLHERERMMYSRINTCFNIINILTTCVSAVVMGVLSSIGSVSPSTQSNISIVFGSLLVIPTIINSLQQSFNFEKIAELHKTASYKFLSLSNDIRYNITLEDDKVEEFFKIFSLEYPHIINNTPDISKRSYDLYDKKNSISSSSISISSSSSKKDNICDEIIVEIDNLHTNAGNTRRNDYEYYRYRNNEKN